MRPLLIIVLAGLALTVPAWMSAQTYDHAEVGVFGQYLDFSPTTPHLNLVGLGGRAAFAVSPYVQLEGEMDYDFKRNFTSTFTNGLTTQLVNSRFRPLTGLFGPKFQAGTSGAVRLFVTGKVGFVNFSTSNQNAPAGFRSAVGAVTSGDTRVALYPGAGIESFWGPFGLRVDIGDEIYFDNGSHNNLRLTFGPHIRF
jgi:hypothetical protein